MSYADANETLHPWALPTAQLSPLPRAPGKSSGLESFADPRETSPSLGAASSATFATFVSLAHAIFLSLIRALSPSLVRGRPSVVPHPRPLLRCRVVHVPVGVPRIRSHVVSTNDRAALQMFAILGWARSLCQSVQMGWVRLRINCFIPVLRCGCLSCLVLSCAWLCYHMLSCVGVFVFRLASHCAVACCVVSC